MNRWRIRSYVGANNALIVKEWLNSVPFSVATTFVTHLKFLVGQPPVNWKRPYVSVLSGGKRTRKTGCAGLVELRFDSGNVEYRPLGYYSGPMEFTIVFFAIEKGSAFEPKGACKIAKERKLKIYNNKELAREFDL